MSPQSESKGEEDATKPPSSIPLVAVDLQTVSYRPRVKNGKNKGQRIDVLTNISTNIRPGQLTAWMGPSGSTSVAEHVYGCLTDSLTTLTPSFVSLTMLIYYDYRRQNESLISRR